eukprot:SAG22_NODE_1597_length_4035_cov_2.376270_2_plen_80_part_00
MERVDEYGRWTTNLTRFPAGMASVAAAVRARGQKFGLYINPGVAVAAVKYKTMVEGTNWRPRTRCSRFGWPTIATARPF